MAKNTGKNLRIHVVDCGISAENRRKILEITAKYGNVSSVRVRAPRRIDVFENFITPKHFNSSIFYRLTIGETFPDIAEDRYIYIDCDVLVDGDIAELWNVDLKNAAFGAVSEDKNFVNSLRRRASLGIAHAEYFNSGVMLIDGKKFMESEIFERTLKFVETTEMELGCSEQDAMNACLGEHECLPLSPKFNFMPFAEYSKRCLRRDGNPVIVHYAGPKPWVINRRVAQLMESVHLFQHSSRMLMKFWKYADEVDGVTFPNSKSNSQTADFFCKRLLQPIERTIRKSWKTLTGQRGKFAY
jgi:lipopolysaccharide biosynthesis glycosyltransferase